MAWSIIPARFLGEKTSKFVVKTLDFAGVKNPHVKDMARMGTYLLTAGTVNALCLDPFGKGHTLFHTATMHDNHALASSKVHFGTEYRYDIAGQTTSGHAIGSDSAGNYYDKVTGDRVSRY